MLVNRQVAVSVQNGKRVVKSRQWRTFGGAPVPGKLKTWGVIEEFHESDKIMCDFDDPKERGRQFMPCPPVQSLIHTFGLTIVWQRWDRTQHGWHLIVKIKQRLTLAEIIAAQAILGSDRNRERLNLARAISLRLHPSRFWERRANILYSRKIT